MRNLGSLRWRWLVVFLLLGACAAVDPVGEPVLKPPHGDLVQKARNWTEEEGRVAAAKQVDRELVALDDSGGAFERRLMRTNADKSFTYPDAVLKLPIARRQKLGIYFILGFNQDRGRAPPIIRQAAVRMRERGFRSRVLDVPGRKTAEEDARMVRDFLREELPLVDRAILVGFSKGAADLAEFWLGDAHSLPPVQLRKVRLWLNFAGVLRGSEVSRWLATDPGVRASTLRAFVNYKSGTPDARFDDLASIAGDPWFMTKRSLPKGRARDLLAINMVIVPEGPEGWSELDPLFEFLGRQAAAGPRTIGPCDGLVESAASVLPPRAGLPQWVVRVRGSHAFLDGSYPNGSPVAPGYPEKGEARLESGSELLDDFLRALPKSAVGW